MAIGQICGYRLCGARLRVLERDALRHEGHVLRGKLRLRAAELGGRVLDGLGLVVVHGIDDTRLGLLGRERPGQDLRHLGFARGQIRLITRVLRVAVLLERGFGNVELLLGQMHVRWIQRLRRALAGAIVDVARRHQPAGGSEVPQPKVPTAVVKAKIPIVFMLFITVLPDRRSWLFARRIR